MSDAEASARYRELSRGESSLSAFDARVYAFYSHLTDLYPEIDRLPETELDACPWTCALDMSGGHLILAIQPEKAGKVVPEILALAGQYGLLCFDPQAGKTYLPPHLRTRRAGSA